MKVTCTDQKTFQLTDNGRLLGRLTYKNLFSNSAELILSDTEGYKIQSVGFFGTSIRVAKNETEIATLRMNWKGQIIMAFQEGQEFIFKTTGWFNNQYTIENKEGEKILQLDPKFNWSTFIYQYDISYDKKPEHVLLVLLGIYAANYYMAAMSGHV